MSKRTNRLEAWVGRMSRLLEVKNFNERRQAIRRDCVYGMGNFCNGHANRGYVKAEDCVDKKPCEYFINGRCTFEKIKENRRSNEK